MYKSNGRYARAANYQYQMPVPNVRNRNTPPMCNLTARDYHIVNMRVKYLLTPVGQLVPLRAELCSL